MVIQYDIIKLNLNPVQGNEKGNYRPCLVVNITEFTKQSDFAWVIPITSRKQSRYPTDVIVETEKGLINGVVDCAHIRTVDLYTRSHQKVDVLKANKIEEVKDILTGIMDL
ncbi:type II toxin-antitoxin system PemK/MazF family toxin [Mammaliicoccus vitulinus]|uniref:type II toxin-antitoxin system PemK/MazF family toxin n=1 Tax=Mammaliicoccus vitulinus TaxID=71237 RepID=UPI001AE0C804|nr:type II toxin-antitoxin system PemK/MazF family toxin [Mammaliicoccus vitulinus]QTN10966.1 type II toxin-antitoxin system PemK/MazF family toxin [Mammaliicoccus vitulinus]WQK88084.1 type II toxin-antitoxin system PemK/MazF family toxin [Mammaliicoccus vitulinus]